MAAPAFSNSANTPRAGASSATYVVNLPTYSAGDLVLIEIYGNMGGSGDTMAATGWTQIFRVQDGSSRTTTVVFAFWRVMTGSEGSTVTFTVSGTLASSSRPIARSATYTGADTTSPIEAVATAKNAGSGATTWSTNSLTTLGPDRTLVMIMGSASSEISTFTGGTKRYGVNAGAFGGDSAQWMDLIDWPASTAGSYSKSGNIGFGFWGSALFAIKPFVASTSIKTWEGLADASTKSALGVARASVKSGEGLG